MDAPDHKVPSDLIEKAKDKVSWNKRVRALCPMLRMCEPQDDGRRGLEHYNV